MLKGRYRDIVTDGAGRRLSESPWRPNRIVDGAYSLVAALMKGEPETSGIRYWAIGAGSPEWDGARPPTRGGTTRLFAEVHRLPIPAEAVVFVDPRGAEQRRAHPELEIRLAFELREAVALREFGVFGGDAEGAADSGAMVNHVIHPRIDLHPGQRLTRTLRLSFGPAPERRWVDVPPHPLGDATVRLVDGIGDRYAAALEAAGIHTVEALAHRDPDPEVEGVSRVRRIEFRAKARLALRTLGEIEPPAALQGLTVAQVVLRPPAEVAAETGIAEGELAQLREQLALLELALDHSVLGRWPVGSLAPEAG